MDWLWGFREQGESALTSSSELSNLLGGEARKRRICQEWEDGGELGEGIRRSNLTTLLLECQLNTQVDISEMQGVFEYQVQGCTETRDTKLGVVVMWLTLRERVRVKKRGPPQRALRSPSFERWRRREGRSWKETENESPFNEEGIPGECAVMEARKERNETSQMLQKTKANTRNWPLPWATWKGHEWPGQLHAPCSIESKHLSSQVSS